MKFVILIFKGFILGCTAIIPGVSIGTMALVLEVYEPALDYFSIAIQPLQWTRQTILTLTKFFLPLATGLAMAMFVFATLMEWLLSNYPAFVQLAFMGIIIGSLPHIYKAHIKSHVDIKYLFYFLFGIVIILFFAFSDTLFDTGRETTAVILDTSARSILIAFFIGALSSACGLIPGVSGSFVLLIIGYYSTYLTIIKDLEIILLIPILLGHIVGFIITAIALKQLLHKFPAQSYSTIFGMLLASIIAIFPFANIGDIVHSSFLITGLNILFALFCLVFGILLSKLGTLSSTNKAMNN